MRIVAGLYLLLGTLKLATEANELQPEGGKNCDCGQRTFNGSGMLNSPNYPHQYCNNADCTYDISVPDDSLVQIRIVKFNTERSADVLYVYDQTPDGKLYKLSGGPENEGTVITAKSSRLRLRFLSDTSVQLTGFLIFFEPVTAADACGPSNYTASEGAIRSPGFPAPYPASTDCYYHVQVPVDRVVRLRIVRFSTAVGRDFLFVYPQRDRVIVLSGGEENVGRVFYSTTNRLTVRFTSDASSGGDTGFLATFEGALTDPQFNCGPADYARPTGLIQSPNYPNDYYNDQQCNYRITVQSGKFIKLTLVSFWTEFPKDVLYVYDGAGGDGSATRYSGLLPSALTTYSNSNRLNLRFITNHNVTAKGFLIFYEEVVASPSCGCPSPFYNASFGTVQSPSYPFNYCHNENCAYEIGLDDASKVVKLRIVKFDLAADEDFLYVFYGASSGGDGQFFALTGNATANEGRVLTSTSSEMRLHFRSADATGPGHGGFLAFYEAVHAPTPAPPAPV